MLWFPSISFYTAGLGDATASEDFGGGDSNRLGNTDFGDTNAGSTGNNTNLGLLFDTFVPTSSVLTIFIVVGFTLPRHQYFGLFWLFWWVVAVCVSLLSVDDDENTTIVDGGGGLFPSTSANDRISGIIVLLGFPVAMWLVLWVWWKKEASSSSSSSSPSLWRQRQKRRWGMLPTIDPIREFVLKYIPLWSMTAIHIYRLDGLSVLVPFWNGEVPNFVGYQTILLDVIMGITAIPLTYLLYVPKNPRTHSITRTRSMRGNKTEPRGFSPTFLRDALWFWNSIGFYDLCSAYLVMVLNACGWGGSHITQPPLLPRLGRHPFPLLLLFQVPLAVVVHVLMLTHGEELGKAREQQLQNSRDGGLLLPTTVTAAIAHRRS